MLPILANLLLKAISLDALFVSFAQIVINKEDKPSFVCLPASPTASWRLPMNASWTLLMLSSESHILPGHQGSPFGLAS